MILNFPGGVNLERRSQYGKQKIKYIDSVPAVCIYVPENAVTEVIPAETVAKGAYIGKIDGTPVYSPLSGIFKGLATLGGERFFVVVSDGSFNEEAPYPAETRPLTDLTKKDITDLARRYSIIDSRSGEPLWKMLQALNKCRRLVVDCTESDPASAINYRLCVEKAKSAVGGAKVLIQATGALKCVFAFEHYRKRCYDYLSDFATDEKLFVPAPMAEKYPYGDRALMSALYLTELKAHERATDYGVFIVGIETVCALYDAIVSGVPQIGRYISFCGSNPLNGGNFYVPNGITLRDLSAISNYTKGDELLIENSTLSGEPISAAVKNSTRAVIALKPQSKPRATCIYCSRCADACPMKLNPREVLTAKNEILTKLCISCGACDFTCPAGIPLMSLINSKEEQENEQ